MGIEQTSAVLGPNRTSGKNERNGAYGDKSAQRTEVKSANWHQPPDRNDIEANKLKEPEGERIRAELEDFIRRNHIVGIMLDTDQHHVSIHINRLPPRIKSVLSIWGAISVVDWVGHVTARLNGKK